MFTFSEKRVAYPPTNNGNNDKSKVGALGLTADEFENVLKILIRRSNSLFLPDSSTPPNNLLSLTKTKQNSLMGILGSNKQKEIGTSGGNDNNNYRNNLKTRIEAEEAQIKSVFETMASTAASKDNPLKLEEENLILPAHPWTAPTEKHLEHIFREGLCLNASTARGKLGRYLSNEEAGENPFLLTIRCEIRILQCLLLNFAWFVNRLFYVMTRLKVESVASSSYVVSNDARSNIWADMDVSHFIRGENVACALEFLERDYGRVYDEIKNSGSNPTYFAVDFEIVDNVIGLVRSDAEYQGSACVEWKCFNSLKKNSAVDFDAISKFDNVLLGGGKFLADNDKDCSAAALTAAAASAVNIANPGWDNKSGGGGKGGSIFDAAIPVTDSSVWMKSILESGMKGYDSEEGDGGKKCAAKREKYRCGESTASVCQSSAVTLAVMPKGNECKVLVSDMIKFIKKYLDSVEDCYMYCKDCVFPEDQKEIYQENRDVYLAVICSNPANVYRVVCCLFANLLMPVLRNPLQDSNQVSGPCPSANGIIGSTTRIKYVTEHGCRDMQYGASQYAKGKMRISKKRSCECRRMCNDVYCFDTSRLTNSCAKTGSGYPDPGTKRRHNAHRCCIHNFGFLDKIRSEALKVSKKNKPLKKEDCTLEHDFLAQDSQAFDLLNKCFLSAGLHHIFCPDVLMVHRGDNFNINLENNKLECFSETNQTEVVTSSQKVNAKEALGDIVKNKMKNGTDIIENIKKEEISFREFSSNLSRAVREWNRLTHLLCSKNLCVRSAFDYHGAIEAVLAYVFGSLPILKTILSVVEIKELKEHYDVFVQNKKKNTTIKLAFNLFKAMVKFILRNYNASVASAINRRGYLASTAVITGYRFQLDGNNINYHETLASVSSCIAFADYYSSATQFEDNEKNIFKIDDNAADFLSDLKEDTFSNTEIFMKFIAKDLLDCEEEEEMDAEEKEEEKEREEKREEKEGGKEKEEDKEKDKKKEKVEEKGEKSDEEKEEEEKREEKEEGVVITRTNLMDVYTPLVGTRENKRKKIEEKEEEAAKVKTRRNSPYYISDEEQVF